MQAKADLLSEHQHAVSIGAAKGLFGGLAVAAPAAMFAAYKYPQYRALPPSLKALGVVLVVVPAFAISAEQASREFEKAHRPGAQGEEIRRERTARKEEKQWDSLPFSQKVLDFTARHQYSLIAGSWAIGIAGAFTYIMRDPLQTMSQKVVQARMFSQGMTIGMVIAAAAITRTRDYRRDESDVDKKVNLDHSWQEALMHEDRNRAGGR